MGRNLTIGQLANMAGVTAKTIRYYEQIGVLPIPRRTSSGYRQYEESSAEQLRFIRRARSLGLPLRQLRVLARALNGGATPRFRPRLLALVQEQLTLVERRIGELDGLRQQLGEIARHMETSPRPPANGPCRCLEVARPSARRARRTTHGRLRAS